MGLETTNFNPTSGFDHHFTFTGSPTLQLQVLMASPDEPEFQYLERYQVLICSTCKYAVQNLAIHLRDQHTISQERRKEIIHSYSHL